MNFATPVKYGAIGGMIVVIFTLLMYLVYPTFFASFMSNALILPVLFAMIWGGITYRTELGNEVFFFKVLLAVIIIGAICILLNDIFMYILMKYIDPELPIMIKRKVIENTREFLEKFNTPEDKIDEGMARVESQDYNPTILNTLMRFGVAMIGVVISGLIVSIFISRNPNRVRKPEFDDQGNYVKPDNGEAN